MEISIKLINCCIKMVRVRTNSLAKTSSYNGPTYPFLNKSFYHEKNNSGNRGNPSNFIRCNSELFSSILRLGSKSGRSDEYIGFINYEIFLNDYCVTHSG